MIKDINAEKAPISGEEKPSGPRQIEGGASFFRGRGGNRSRRCPFEDTQDPIDCKDVKLLKKFLTDRGKIIPKRVSSVSAKRQRELSSAIKRARFLALLPYVID